MMFGWFLLTLSILGIAVFAAYPLFVALASRFAKPYQPPQTVPPLSVTVLIVARNSRALLEEKIENLRSVHFPGDWEVRICSDGSTDDTQSFIENLDDPRFHVKHFQEQIGKNACLTAVIPECVGEVIVFTDADAMLSEKAVENLVAHFNNPEVGGVCGQRQIRASGGSMVAPQSGYISMDSWIKEQENALGSITSNDGKLYAVRRKLVREVPGPVTDDLWQALGVVKQGFRFVFEGEALAYIRTPSRSFQHELTRRRRVVSRGVNGIFKTRTVLNPFRYGFFSFGLFINKVDRRLLPFWLLGILLACFLLIPVSQVFLFLAALQVIGYIGIGLFGIMGLDRILPKKLAKLSQTAAYFLVGNVGMALGFIDFLLGRAPSQWEPKKSG